MVPTKTTTKVKEPQAMELIPSSVYGTIRLALEANLRDYHRMDGIRIENADLYADIISAVKWAHENSEQTALHLVQSALTSVSTDEGGPTLETAAECLRHSLTQPGSSPREWSREEADRFVTAALLVH